MVMFGTLASATHTGGFGKGVDEGWYVDMSGDGKREPDEPSFRAAGAFGITTLGNVMLGLDDLPGTSSRWADELGLMSG
jgi:hypothetical protein